MAYLLNILNSIDLNKPSCIEHISETKYRNELQRVNIPTYKQLRAQPVLNRIREK